MMNSILDVTVRRLSKFTIVYEVELWNVLFCFSDGLER